MQPSTLHLLLEVATLPLAAWGGVNCWRLTRLGRRVYGGRAADVSWLLVLFASVSITNLLHILEAWQGLGVAETVIPATWLLGKVLLVMLLYGVVDSEAKPMSRRITTAVLLFSLVASASLALVAFPYYSDTFPVFGRPEELFPAAIGVGMLLILRQRPLAKPRHMTIEAALVVFIVAQMVMGFSRSLFDFPFHAAHVLQIVVLGLLVNYTRMVAWVAQQQVAIRQGGA